MRFPMPIEISSCIGTLSRRTFWSMQPASPPPQPYDAAWNPPPEPPERPLLMEAELRGEFISKDFYGTVTALPVRMPALPPRPVWSSAPQPVRLLTEGLFES